MLVGVKTSDERSDTLVCHYDKEGNLIFAEYGAGKSLTDSNSYLITVIPSKNDYLIASIVRTDENGNEETIYNMK